MKRVDKPKHKTSLFFEGGEEVIVKTSRIEVHFKYFNNIIKEFGIPDSLIVTLATKDGFQFCYDIIKNLTLKPDNVGVALEAIVAAHSLNFDYLSLIYERTRDIVRQSFFYEQEKEEEDVDSDNWSNEREEYQFDANTANTFTPIQTTVKSNPKTLLEMPRSILSHFLTNAYTTNELTWGFCRNKQLRSLFYEAIGKRLTSDLKVFLNFETSENTAAYIYLWASTVNVSLSYGGPGTKQLERALRIEFDEDCVGDLKVVCHLIKTYGSYDNLIARTLEVKQIKQAERLQEEEQKQKEELERNVKFQNSIVQANQKKKEKENRTESLKQSCAQYEAILQTRGYRNLSSFIRISKHKHFEKDILNSSLDMDELVSAFFEYCKPLLKVGNLDKLANYTTQNNFLQLAKNINDW